MTTRSIAVGLLGALLVAAPLTGSDPHRTASGRRLSGRYGPGPEPALDRFRRPSPPTSMATRRGSIVTGTTAPDPCSRGFRWTRARTTAATGASRPTTSATVTSGSAPTSSSSAASRAGSNTTRSRTSRYSTRTPFTVVNDTTVTVDHALQAAIQAGQATLNPAVENFASPFELRAKRDITTLGGQYQLNRSTDINFALVSTGRNGHQPWGASFGMASTFEVPAPIQQRDTEIAANIEWANRKAMFKAGYDSWLSTARRSRSRSTTRCA